MSAQDTRPRVLIVDDDASIRRLLGRILPDAEYECFFASDAGEARAQLDEMSFAIALCDVQLPGESGLALAEHILTDYPQTATLMMSGIDDAAVAQVALESGAYGYLIKPFKANEVRISAVNALRRRALEVAQHSVQDHLEHEVRARSAELETSLERLQASAEEVRRSRAQTIEWLARAVEYRDPETGGHIERMSRYCALLADPLGLHPESMQLVAPVHDVGKIAVPDHILLKPGPLSADERKHMEAHADIGYRILTGSGSQLLELAAKIAWTHHEKYDGTGYPRGAACEEIPLEGRIAALADVFDALTSDRVYRPAFSLDQAVEMIRSEREKHFDPDVLDAFLVALPAIIEVRQRFSDSVSPPPGAGLGPTGTALQVLSRPVNGRPV